MLWKNNDLAIETVLLHCTPPDLWQTQVNAIEHFGLYKCDLLVPTRAIVAKDLERLLFYAPLINKLTFGRAADQPRSMLMRSDIPIVQLSEDGFVALSYILPPSFLRNIRHVVWYSRAAGLHHIRHFISPSLATLELRLHHVPAAYLSILQTLPTAFPKVHGLSIYADEKDAPPGSMNIALAHLLGGSWDLRRLNATSVGSATLLDLARMPSLASLTIDSLSNMRAEDVLPSHSFASLRTLSVNLDVPMRTCIAIMQSANFTALTSLSLSLKDPLPGDWAKLYRAIRTAHTRPALLTTLRVEQQSIGEDDGLPAPPVTDDDLAPLLDFGSLQDLWLQCEGGFDIGPATAERIAKAYPKLQELTLVPMRCPTWTRRLTLAALEPFARYCPVLQYLELELNGTGVTFDRNPARPSIAGSRPMPPSLLLCLGVRWSPINSSRAVAAYLSLFFPRLGYVTTADELSGRRWRRVGELVTVFAKIRAHERLEAAGSTSATTQEYSTLLVDDSAMLSGSEGGNDDD
ncbi:uncharacterized protein SCHCODRAFT_02704843 [Schizophyllum commune H4-8]|uniref:F-box domain-containing protein n=1 Tax=Schizophyllum commune (strain H4-8 / FGSC 9210) TaxID=578458 RepID=D8QF21_SCHCM|nr:uncharacterized protein SCHCODRAFT_02704843 [Schizophyllum commune H4-8]KAI5887449.1 hypothetical protein SCHCODRAFT_02704843 [Schizophyllum commune H4-8]